jgi:hypothetical protein
MSVGGRLRRPWGNPDASKHPPKVDYLLLVDVMMPRGIKRLSFRTQGHRVAAIMLFSDRGYLLQEREDVVPLNIVTDRVVEDLLHCRPVVSV